MDDQYREMEQQGTPVEVLPDRVRVFRGEWTWDYCDDGTTEGRGPPIVLDEEEERAWRRMTAPRSAWWDVVCWLLFMVGLSAMVWLMLTPRR